MSERLTRVRRVLPLLALLATGCVAAPAPVSAPLPTAAAAPAPVSAPLPTAAAAPVAAGRAEETTGARRTLRGNIESFAPGEATSSVNVEGLNLKQVFERVGGDSALWYQHVQTLANPYFEGRSDGSPGMERARQYIEFYYQLYGLEPAFPDG
jgi:hypothetical protein